MNNKYGIYLNNNCRETFDTIQGATLLFNHLKGEHHAGMTLKLVRIEDGIPTRTIASHSYTNYKI